eukprot:6072468-Pyramimonas_sp.AAC.2
MPQGTLEDPERLSLSSYCIVMPPGGARVRRDRAGRVSLAISRPKGGALERPPGPRRPLLLYVLLSSSPSSPSTLSLLLAPRPPQKEPNIKLPFLLALGVTRKADSLCSGDPGRACGTSSRRKSGEA